MKSLHWEWIVSRFGKRKYIAIGEYLEFVREGIRDGSNPGLKATGQKYGVRSYFSVSKAVSRFRQRLAKDHTLNIKFKNVLSNVYRWVTLILPQTLWLGLQRLDDITEMWKISMSVLAPYLFHPPPVSSIKCG